MSSITSTGDTPVDFLSRESKMFSKSLWPQKYSEWLSFKNKCTLLGLETTYQLYCKQIYNNYLKTFMTLHIMITIIHSFAIYFGKENPDSSYRDAIIYITGCIFVVITLIFYLANKRVKYYKEYGYITHILSWWICIIMTFSDISVGLCHYLQHQDKFLRPCYCGYTISCLYLFMPIPLFLPSILLGVFISAVYALSFTFVSYYRPDGKADTLEINSFLPDVFYLIGLNLLGFGSRLHRDFETRKVFLTKRESIEENFILKYAKDQEKSLVISIIPPEIAQKISQEIKSRIRRSRVVGKFAMTGQSRKLFIEAHYDVSILFADVVNYTKLTTSLDVKTLVETLHDLFQRFDAACLEYNVMRIKFLGDCYYCVAGVPVTHPFHGLCCIELGRSIINHIMEVRNIRNLDINMRIGIHSGNIFSGIIGSAKWQYDIWSKDVDIASCLEQTGVAGRVHISDATLNLVKGFYIYEEGPERAKTDPFLQKQLIKTYIIIEPSEYMTNSIEWRQYMKKNKIQGRQTNNTDTVMGQNAINYTELRNRTNMQLIKDLDSLPICKLNIKEQCFKPMKRLESHQTEDYMARRNITTCCLLFSDWNSTVRFFNDPDEILQFNITMMFLLLIFIMGSQILNQIHQNILIFALFYSFVFVFGFLLVLLVHFNELWLKYSLSFGNRNTNNKCFFILYRLSNSIEKNAVLRGFTYLTIIGFLLSTAFIHLMLCDRAKLENDDLLIFEFLEGGRRVLCFNSWAVTNSIVLVLGAIFSFIQVPYVFQMILGLSITLLYGTIIFDEYSLVYESSLETNVEISAEYNHMWNVIIALMIYQLISRHIAYISKVAAFYKWRLEKKIDNARMTNESIKILLHNILPSHVVSIYLSKRMRNEPYYEQHEYVAVMFATIIYPRTGSIELRLLNEIICDFDEILALYKGPIRVEKIKVANWSYMAACGFKLPASKMNSAVYFQETLTKSNRRRNAKTFERDSNESEVNYRNSDNINSSSTSDEDLIHSDADFVSLMENHRRDITRVITYFALDLLHSIKAFNKVNQLDQGLDTDTDEKSISLRIGISSGEVMAGIVGQSQAHYDIWGNSVNMASRMDTTSEPGKIHVTEETANILKSFNINCEYRGMTFVKGRGSIPTYYVGLTNDLEFEEVPR